MKKRRYNRVQKIREKEEIETARKLAEAKEKKYQSFRKGILLSVTVVMFFVAYAVSKSGNLKMMVSEEVHQTSSPEEVGNDLPDETLADMDLTIDREKTLDALIQEYADYRELDPESYSYYIENLETGEVYKYNEKTNFVAASTYKLPLAMLWMDRIANGECSLESEYLFDASRYEAGGPIGYTYELGSYIDLKTIIEATIISSDNSGGHILFEELGGYGEYKKAVTKYCEIPQEEIFFTNENYFNAEFMNSVLKQLYYHPKTYELLIEDLLMAEPERYLNSQLNGITAQKYGSYNQAQNAVGIVYEGQHYSIAIYTTFGGYGSVYIGEINEIVYRYFNDIS